MAQFKGTRRYRRQAGVLCALWLILSAVSVSADVRLIAPRDLMARLSSPKKLVLLDVRTVPEFEQGHIPRAVNIPLSQLPRRLSEIRADHQQPVFVYCRTGRRARVAARFLLRAGFQQIVLLEGDMGGWTRLGLPVETGP